jgi:hypothetical protein
VLALLLVSSVSKMRLLLSYYGELPNGLRLLGWRSMMSPLSSLILSLLGVVPMTIPLVSSSCGFWMLTLYPFRIELPSEKWKSAEVP